MRVQRADFKLPLPKPGCRLHRPLYLLLWDAGRGFRKGETEARSCARTRRELPVSESDSAPRFPALPPGRSAMCRARSRPRPRRVRPEAPAPSSKASSSPAVHPSDSEWPGGSWLPGG